MFDAAHESAYGTELAEPALRPNGSYYQKKTDLGDLAAPPRFGGMLPEAFQGLREGPLARSRGKVRGRGG